MSNEHLDENARSSCSSSSKNGGRICNYKDLRVWQDAMDLAEQVYIETKSFPASETLGLRKQIRDAATSIPSNVAEGHRRRGDRAFLWFTGIAAASHAELETRLELARRFRFIDRAASARLTASTDRVGKQLTELLRELSNRIRR
jgi:four helix bundle protein